MYGLLRRTGIKTKQQQKFEVYKKDKHKHISNQ